LILSLLTSSWARRFKRNEHEAIGDSEEDNRATMRRLIEEGIGGEGYHDEPRASFAPALEPAATPEIHGPTVIPSQLGESRNEWRDDGEEHGD